MDDIICGLNKVVCKAATSTYNSYWVKITNGKWTSSKQMSSGSVTFLVPSIPAPGKKTYTISLSAAQNGSVVYQVETELGFGDSTVIYLGSTSYINEKDTIILGTGLGATKSGNKMTINHANSGVTSGSYGPSSAVSSGYKESFNVPYLTVDARGHVTSASNKTISINSSKIDVIDYAEKTLHTRVYDGGCQLIFNNNLLSTYGINSDDKIIIALNPWLGINGPGSIYPIVRRIERGSFGGITSNGFEIEGFVRWNNDEVDDFVERNFTCKLVVVRA